MATTNLPFSRFFGDSKKLTVRRVIRLLHLYSGLLCSGYFIMIGLSSISFNHPDTWVAPAAQTLRWEAVVQSTGPQASGKLARARDLKASLGMIGRLPPWRIEETGAGSLSFFVWRPGRSYQVEFIEKSGRVRVDETREGVWGVLRHLHGLPQIGEPRRWSQAWWIYNEIALASVLLAVVSGAVLWWPRIRERRAGLVVALIGSAACLVLMFAVWR